MATDKLGLYVHIPYCVRKCNYCDFCSLPNGRREVPDSYVDALVSEILSYKKSEKRVLSTVYFGGGTPSLLSPTQAGKIASAIRESFDLIPDPELTFEANPGTLTEEKARAFKSLGFNRVSLGLQSIHEKEMKELGRIHNFDEFLSSFELLRNAGFDNINVLYLQLIYKDECKHACCWMPCWHVAIGKCHDFYIACLDWIKCDLVMINLVLIFCGQVGIYLVIYLCEVFSIV